jgi:two-component system phosphate regulon sensor histidine kinase PhoR
MAKAFRNRRQYFRRRVARGKGDFVTRFSPTLRRIRRHRRSINDMIEQIRYLFDQLTAEKEEFHGIVSSLREALWVIDDRDRIVFANETFKKLVNREDLEGVAYWQALRLHELDLIVQKTKDTRDRVVEEIEYEGSVFVASAQYIATKSEIIILFHDISQIRIAEEIKKNIVSSVSHELRTPLTSILGYLETLIAEEKDETRRKYLEVIERNAKRMFYLTKDLLELSSLESPSAELQAGKIDVTALADSMKRLFEKRFAEKGLSFSVEAAKGAELRGDVYKIEQMLVNLIDNALKYTETGGVKVSFRSEGGDSIVEVSDTGIGIAAKHQSQVFERFYVVDKSRSRAEGGTGLGLSIVQKISRVTTARQLKSGWGRARRS